MRTRKITYYHRQFHGARSAWTAAHQQVRFFRALGAKGKRFSFRLTYSDDVQCPSCVRSGATWYEVRVTDIDRILWISRGYDSLVICGRAWRVLFSDDLGGDGKTLGWVKVDLL